MQAKDREIALLQQQLRRNVRSVKFISQITKSFSWLQETELVQAKDRETLQQQLNNVSHE